MAVFQRLLSQIQAFVTPDVNLDNLSQEMDEKAIRFAEVFRGQQAPAKKLSESTSADLKSYDISSTQSSLRTAASWYNGQVWFTLRNSYAKDFLIIFSNVVMVFIFLKELKLLEGYIGLKDPNSPGEQKYQPFYSPSIAKSSGKIRVIDLMLTWRLSSSDNLTSGINNWRKTNTNLEVRIGPVLLDYESFDAGSASASRLKVRVKDVRVYDVKRAVRKPIHCNYSCCIHNCLNPNKI